VYVWRPSRINPAKPERLDRLVFLGVDPVSVVVVCGSGEYSMSAMRTTTPRKPSARSTRADPLRASLRSSACGSVLRPARLALSVHQAPHSSPALPLVGRRDGLPAGRLRSGQEA